MFMPRRTFTNPGRSQAGFPSPGSGAQRTGAPAQPPSLPVEPVSALPPKGFASWLFPTAPADAQRGSPSPEAPDQRRPKGSMPNVPPVFGGVGYIETPYYDRGAAAFVPQTGKVLYNPIGAGIYAQFRPQSSYGPAGEYQNGSIWWTSQTVPTTVGLTGLTSPEVLQALLGRVNVQAAVRVG